MLDEDISAKLKEDIQEFRSSGEWYLNKGVPYRRGYLMYGPPGTGKTSFVQAIAGDLGLNLCYLNLSSSQIDDNKLNKIMSEAPENSILLLEDVDSMFVQRDEGIQRNSITFSGFLNALDGVRSQEGQILFMSTNHKERLDPALLRPGRADVHVKLDYASEKQIVGLFKRFFPEASEERAREFSDQIPVHKLSMAKLQGHFLKYREDEQTVIDKAPELLDEESAVQADLTVQEWLHRINLPQLQEGFKKHKFFRMADLGCIGDQGQLGELEITSDLLEQRRFWQMLSGDQESKDNFKYLTKHGIRQMAKSYLDSEQKIALLEEHIPDKALTGF